jgi:hypothetical protein
MWRIRGDVDRFARAYSLFRATKNNVEFAFKQGESLFEVVPVRGRSAAGRYVHVDQAKSARRVFGREKNSVGISDHANVWNFLAGVRLCNRKFTLRVVRWDS